MMGNRANWGWRKDTKWYNAVTQEANKHKYICDVCGHRMFIPYNKEQVICDWCGYPIFKDEKARFKDKMKKMLKQR